MSRQPEDEFRDVIAELRRTAPEPPPVHWGAYRAELRNCVQMTGDQRESCLDQAIEKHDRA